MDLENSSRKLITGIVGKFDLTPSCFLPAQSPFRENLSVSTRYPNTPVSGTRGLNWRNARGQNHPRGFRGTGRKNNERCHQRAMHGVCCFSIAVLRGCTFYRLVVVNDVHAPRNFSMQNLHLRAPASSNVPICPKLEKGSTRGDLVSRASRGERLEFFRIVNRGGFLSVDVGTQEWARLASRARLR